MKIGFVGLLKKHGLQPMDILASKSVLRPRDHDIVTGRMRGETYKALAVRYDVTPERIRQRENRAFRDIVNAGKRTTPTDAILELQLDIRSRETRRLSPWYLAKMELQTMSHEELA